MLRWAKGYDSNQMLLLPLREVGGSLPSELVEAYTTEQKMKEEEKKAVEARRSASLVNTLALQPQDVEGSAVTIAMEGSTAGLESTTSVLSTKMSVPDVVDKSLTTISSHATMAAGATAGQEQGVTTVSKLMLETNVSGLADVELSPVGLAVARYLGVDFSPEAVAARGRRGLALIIHGAPLSGKSMHAADLASRFKCAHLTIDGIIHEAVSRRTTAAGKKAYQQLIELTSSRAPGSQEAPENPEGTSEEPAGKVASSDASNSLESSSQVKIDKESGSTTSLLPTNSAGELEKSLVAPLPEALAAEILADRFKVKGGGHYAIQ